MHFVQRPNSPVDLPIDYGVQKNVWKYISGGGWHYLTSASMSVDPIADTMTLTGTIPGINAGSRLIFVTHDSNPKNSGMDTSFCGVTSGWVSQPMGFSLQQESGETIQDWNIAQKK